MPLLDPPEYVALPVALVYADHNLAPEYRRRLEQIIGWMWVTKRSKKPLGANIHELSGRWGIKPRAVYHTLQVLDEAGYLAIDYNNRGWAHITLGPALDNTHAARGSSPTGHTHTQTRGESPHTDTPREAATDTRGEPATNRATPLHDFEQTGEDRAMPLHDLDTQRQNRATDPLRDPSTSSTVVVVDPDTGESETRTQQQHSTMPAQRHDAAEVLAALDAAGIWPDKAPELAADPWVTACRVTAWCEHLRALKAAGKCIAGRPIGSVGALVAANLQAHREPPAAEPAEEAEGWRRFVQGEYAEYCR